MPRLSAWRLISCVAVAACTADNTDGFFGDLLATTGADLAVAAALCALVLLGLRAGHRPLALAGFDASAARALGVRPGRVQLGLLVALGAPRRTILLLFLGEAVALSALGGIVGLALGFGLAQVIHFALPALPVHTPISFVLLAEGIAIAIGLLAGVLPARNAARLDPVEALRAE